MSEKYALIYTFTAPASWQGAKLVLADFNGDDFGDIALQETNGSDHQVSIYLSVNGETFSLQQQLPLGNSFSADIIQVDLNNDGLLDLLTTNGYTGDVYWMKGRGDGTFDAQLAIANVGVPPTQVSALHLATADFDLNGSIDIAVSGYATSKTHIFLFTNETVTSQVLPSSGGSWTRGIATGDFNLDGWMDSAVTNVNSNNLVLRYGPNFSTGQTLQTGGYSLMVAAGDFDGDGDQDLATADATTSDLSVFWNQAGTFTRATYLFNGVGSNLQSHDLDGDGSDDLVFGTGTSLAIMSFYSDQSSSTQFIPIGIGINAIGVGHIDDDGDLDIAAASSDGSKVFVLASQAINSNLPTGLESRWALIASETKSAQAGESLYYPPQIAATGDGRLILATTVVTSQQTDIEYGFYSTTSLLPLSQDFSISGAGNQDTVELVVRSGIPTLIYQEHTSGGAYGARMTTIFSDGSQSGTKVLSNPYNAYSSVGVFSDGTLVHADGREAGTPRNIYATAFDSDGVASGASFLVHGGANEQIAFDERIVTLPGSKKFLTLSTSFGSASRGYLDANASGVVLVLSDAASAQTLTSVTLSSTQGDLSKSIVMNDDGYGLAFFQSGSQILAQPFTIQNDSFVLDAPQEIYTVNAFTGAIDVGAIALPSGSIVVAITAPTSQSGLERELVLLDVNAATGSATSPPQAISVTTVSSAEDTLPADMTFHEDALFVTWAAPAQNQIELFKLERVTPTYTLTASSASADEGEVLTFTLTTTHVPIGTTVPFTFSGISSADFNYGRPLTGVFTVDANGQANLEITLERDQTTEGAETLTLSLDDSNTQVQVEIADSSDAPQSLSPVLNPVNGHYYQAVENNVGWQQAFDAASAASYRGLKGYLVTITSPDENTFVFETVVRPSGITGWPYPSYTYYQTFWLGASDSVVDGEWRWVSGPESGTQFSSGTATLQGEYSLIAENMYGAGANTFLLVGMIGWRDGLIPPGPGLHQNDARWVTVVGSDTLTGYVIEYGGLTPTYTITASAASINEGNSVTFTIDTTNVEWGTQVPYTISGVDLNDLIQGEALTGNVTVSQNGADGQATVTITTRADLRTEGAETLTLNIFGETASVTLNDTSTTTSPTYALAVSAAQINEGQSATFTLTTTGIPAGTQVGYSLNGISAADLDDPNQMTGQFTIQQNGVATVTIALAEDETTEGTETLNMGTQNLTASVNILDTSTTPPPPATYSLTSPAQAMDEGDQIQITLNTTHVAQGTLLPYTLTGITGSDLVTASQLTGSFTPVDAAGKATLTLLTRADQLTEGDETITLTVAGVTAAIALRDSSTNIVSHSPIRWSGNGHYYQPFETSVSLTQAQAAADASTHRGLYGQLVSVGSQAEQDFLQAIILATGITGDGSLTGHQSIWLDNANGDLVMQVPRSASSVPSGETNAVHFLSGPDSASHGFVIEYGGFSPTFTLTSSGSTAAAGAANEGDTITFSVFTTHVEWGTSLAYTVSGLSATDLSVGALSGSVTVEANGDDGLATLSLTLANDLTTEGTEPLSLSIAGQTIVLSVADTSPTPPPTYALTTAANAVNEGANAIFFLQTTYLPPGTAVPYALTGGVSTADFNQVSLSGSLTIDANGQATLVLPSLADLRTEGDETVTLTLNPTTSQDATASIVLRDTSLTPDPVYTITAPGISVNEGSTATFTLQTQYVDPGTVLPYTLSGLSAADLANAPLSGSVTVNSQGQASLSVPIAADFKTEGLETLTLTIEGASASLYVNDTSVQLTLGTIPNIPTYAVIAASSTVAEGSTASFLVATRHVAIGSVLDYTLSGITGDDLASGSLQGQVTLDNNGQAIIRVDLAADQKTEGDERLQITLRDQTASIRIEDRSQAPFATYFLDPPTRAVEEGGTAEFMLRTSQVPSGTQVAYTITGLSAEDLTSGTLTGEVTVGQDGSAVIAVGIKADALTEGTETLILRVAQQKVRVPVVDSSLTPQATVMVYSESLTVSEGQAVRFLVSSQNLAPGSSLAYALSGIEAADLAGGTLEGTLTLDSNGQASSTFLLAADQRTEGEETLYMTVQGVQSTGVRVVDSSQQPNSPYALSSLLSRIQEGETLTVFVQSSAAYAGQTLSVSVSGIQSQDLKVSSLMAGTLTGAVTLNAQGFAELSFTLAEDKLSEGEETLTLVVQDRSGLSSSFSLPIVDSSRSPSQKIISLGSQPAVVVNQPAQAVSLVQNASTQRWQMTVNGQTETLEGVTRVATLDYVIGLDIQAASGQAYRIYKAIFNREPDLEGLGYWIAQMDKGMSVVELAARFIDSAEYRSLYGSSQDPQAFLTQVYQNVLGRPPDASGLAWWVSQMQGNPEKTPAKVLADFSESAENHTATAPKVSGGVKYIAFGSQPQQASPADVLAALSPSVNEGGMARFEFKPGQALPGAVYDYTISGVSAADLVDGSLTGRVIINENGVGEIVLGLLADKTTEGNELLQIRLGSLTADMMVYDTSLTVKVIGVVPGGG